MSGDKQLMLSEPYGWNTWDVYHLNGVVHLPTLLRLRLGILNTQTGEHLEQFTPYQGMQRLGPHAADGSYSQITLGWDDVSLDCTYASEGDRLICKVRSTGASDRRLTLRVDRGILNGSRSLTMSRADTTFTFDAHDRSWVMHILEPEQYDISGDDGTLITFAANQTIIVSISPSEAQDTLKIDDAGAFIHRCEKSYRQRALSSDGWLTPSAASGLTSAVHWNTIYEPMKGRVCTPVSRNWCMNGWFGDYVLFVWDSFFCALMESLEEPALAIANFRAMMQEMNPRGFLPNFGSALGDSNDRSFVPVGAYCLLKLYRSGQIHADSVNPYRALLEEAFPGLLRWHEWWLPHRDGNGDGLLEYGSDPVPSVDPRWEYHNQQAAKFESGLDNSPLYDNVPFNTAANTFELADVGLSALYALDAWSLAQLANELGHTEQAAALEREYGEVKDRINRELWNEEQGIYQNKHWDGRFSPSLAPTLLYPLLAGIASSEQADRMVREHLLNENEFWGEWVIPSIARSDPTYHEQNYWRGRIWPPFNFLVCEGLRRYGYDDTAHQLARKSLRLFLGEWDTESHSHENYNAETGDGDDRAWNSDPTYHWGALLAYLAMQELADYEVWGGWRFGNLETQPAALRNVRTPDGLLDVETTFGGLQVSLDQQLLLAVDTPAIIRDYRRTARRVACVVARLLANQATITVGGLSPECMCRITVGKDSATVQVDAQGQVHIRCAESQQLIIDLLEDV